MPDQIEAVGVVVVAYGDPALLERCLSDLPQVPVVVVDNGLDDRVRTICRRAGADYVRPERNLGFGTAVNRGVAALPDELDVLLLNPDAVLPEEAAGALARALRGDPRLAAVAPRLVRPDGTPEPSRWPVPGPAQVWLDALGLRRLLARRPHFLTGAVLLLRREAWRQVGPFDERFFLYAEEADWQFRALQAGWRLDVVLSVSAEHQGAGTSSDGSVRDTHFHRSAELFGRKWYGARGWAVMRAGSIAAAGRRAVTGDAAQRRTARRALRHHVRGA